MKFERKRSVIAERNDLRIRIEYKDAIIEELQAKLRGEIHDAGSHCKGCKNIIEIPSGFRPTKFVCKLDYKCEDRVEE